MTATETLTPQNQSSHPPTPPPAARPRRRLLFAAALAVLAVVALAVWLLTTSSQTQTRPVTPTVAGAPQEQPPQLPPWASGDVNAVPDPGSLDSSAAGYAQFCQGSPVLCSPGAPQAPNAGYVQFCQNSPVLCTAAKPN